MENTSPTPAADVATAANPFRWGAKVPKRWFWITAACSLAIMVWASREEFVDHAMANILTLVGGFVISFSLFVWFCFGSAYPKWLRRTVLGLNVVLVIAALAVFRIEHVSGELVPVLAFRWTKSPDQLLEKLPTAPVEAANDLFAATEHDFPQFLGPQRSGRLAGTTLARDWHTQPPALVWKQPIGAGWSAFSIVGGAAVTLEQRDQDELVTCYELATGKLLWSHAVQARHFETLGGPGPRSTPTIHDGKVYALGATGVLRALDLATGKELWQHDVSGEFGLTHDEDMQLVAWGRAASPLVIDELVVVPGGGRPDGPHASLVAYDKASGRKVWQAGERQISYASPSLVELCGQRMILIVNEDTVSGHDPKTGALLFEFPWPGNSTADASNSQALVLSGDRVFVSKGYGHGAVMYQIARGSDGQLTTTEIWRNTSLMKTKFTNIATDGDFAYGLSDGVLECIELKSGKRRWKQGRYGHGQVLLVGDVLIVQAESGEVALVAATPERFEELARLPLIDGKTWNNPAISGPYLLVRNSEEAACYKLSLK